jgi:hypothetical protein
MGDAADKLRTAGIRASVRAGAVRVGFYLYNTETMWTGCSTLWGIAGYSS